MEFSLDQKSPSEIFQNQKFSWTIERLRFKKVNGASVAIITFRLKYNFPASIPMYVMNFKSAPFQHIEKILRRKLWKPRMGEKNSRGNQQLILADYSILLTTSCLGKISTQNQAIWVPQWDGPLCGNAVPDCGLLWYFYLELWHFSFEMIFSFALMETRAQLANFSDVQLFCRIIRSNITQTTTVQQSVTIHKKVTALFHTYRGAISS